LARWGSRRNSTPARIVISAEKDEVVAKFPVLRRRRIAAAACLLVSLTAIAGPGLTARPASAAPRAADPDITITAGGDRITSTSVRGTAGVDFSVSGTVTSNGCPTGTDGRCVVSVPTTASRTVTQTSAPAGWFLNPTLGISPNSTTSAVTPTAYSSLTTGTIPQTGVSVPPSTSGTTAGPTARSGVWALSRDNPPLPSRCGLNVALVFDLSFSIGSNLGTLQAAGRSFVTALNGTPSSVSLWTFGTLAPVNETNNSNFPLTPMTAPTALSDLETHINRFTILSSPAQYTNWDAGLWQVASADAPPGGTRTHYDAVIMLTDGDPTVYGPTGTGSSGAAITRYRDVENGIFSANALKADGTRVIAVGINVSNPGSIDNLKSISGTTGNTPDGDYFTTDFSGLGNVLRGIALEKCSGTVNVTKLVIPAEHQGDIAAAEPSPGWHISASGPTVSPSSAITDETGGVSFQTHTPGSEDVTIGETVEPFHEHFPVDGQNAVCSDINGQPVPATNVDGTGFTVTASHDDIITCKIYNQRSGTPTEIPLEVTTQLSAAGGKITVGGSVHDTATLHGVTATAGGTVEYRVYDSLAQCTLDTNDFPVIPASRGTLVSTVPVTDGVVPPSAAHTFGTAGTFYWAAFYSGDDHNNGSASVCLTEPLVVTPTAAALTTQLSPAGGVITVGDSAHDTAALHGVTATAGGTVEYRLYDTLADCDADTAAFPGTPPSRGTHVSTETVTDGVVPPSAAHTFGTAGTFYWAAFYSGDASNHPAASDCETEPLVVLPPPPAPAASVVVNKDWVIDGVTQRDPNQDPDFQAGLSLTPVIGPGPATWGEERFGYSAGEHIDIAETDVTIPPGCTRTASGDLGTHTLAAGLNEFTVTNTVTCDEPSPDPEVGTHLTLVKQISNPFLQVKLAPLTSWTLTARRAPAEPPVISGTTGVTGNVKPGVKYLLAESSVPGYKQTIHPAVIKLAPGATGSWTCVQNLPAGTSGLEDFDGGTGVVVVQPGQHVTCTAVNLLKRPVPVGPPVTGGGFAPASPAVPLGAAGLALIAVSGLAGIAALRLRRIPHPAPARTRPPPARRGAPVESHPAAAPPEGALSPPDGALSRREGSP
jgi:hypothetical protein